ncbi:MAG: ferredoxin [Syntrophomonadaceae bacterium]|nr:ferredoxin [Syntrophomonadaceae bacterium]
MQVLVDPDLCIECGACIDTCPEVFDWDDEGKAHVMVKEVPTEVESTCQEAVESCPTEAIKEV